MNIEHPTSDIEPWILSSCSPCPSWCPLPFAVKPGEGKADFDPDCDFDLDFGYDDDYENDNDDDDDRELWAFQH